jgi:serine/threonine-protein kinase
VIQPAPVLPPAADLTPAPPSNPPSGALPPVALGPSPSVVPPPATPVDPGEATRTEIAAFVSRLPCSLLDGDVRDGGVQVTGIGGKAAIDNLRQKLTMMGLTSPPPSLRVTQVDQTFCPWEDLLRPLARTFGDGGGRLTLRLADDPPWLVKDDYIRPRLAMADFRGEMHVDYLDRQGNVQHLYPQVANAAAHSAGDTTRSFQPGEVLSLGEPGPNNPGWQVDEPYGTDVIIAIASEDTLFDRPRPSNVEKAAGYLRDLKRAVELARSRGARLTATALPLETRRK